jgi:hypothetical protein
VSPRLKFNNDHYRPYMQTIFGEKQLQHPMKKTKTSYLTGGKQPSTITPKGSVLKRSYLKGASPGSFTQRQQESECARESEMSRTRGTEVKPVVTTTLNA